MSCLIKKEKGKREEITHKTSAGVGISNALAANTHQTPFAGMPDACDGDSV